MTERYGSFGDEGGQRPSGRGAVTERLATRDDDAPEIDLTDEAGPSDAGDDAEPDRDQTEREASGAFEPATPAADPPAGAEPAGSSSIFDVGERARQEDLHRTGYEPPVADTSAAATPGDDAPAAEPPAAETPEAEPSVAEPAVAEPAVAEPAVAEVPVAEPPVAAAPVAGAPGGLLDADTIRSRFLDIQAGFVDEPRQAVEEAGRFVDDLLGQVADALRQQRGQLVGVTEDGSTEDLRLALRAYRQFVDRLLAIAG